MKTAVILALSGILAGFVNGFFGTGGGLIIFSILTFIGCDTRRSLATANFGILVLSLLSFVLYLKTGALDVDSAVGFLKKDAIFAVIGGGVGAWISGKISPTLLKKLFSLLVIVCGVRMVTA